MASSKQNMIVPFDFDGLLIRAFTDEDGQTFFVANEVAAALGYAVPKDAVYAHCKGAVKRRLPTSGGFQQVVCIPERDLYRLVLRSRLPAAERFEDWVVGEVLPSIRKTGQYQNDWRRSRHAAASSAKVMTGILEFVRDAIGKVTKPHHFMNEHKLVNSLLTGEYKGLDREKLNAYELDFLAHFELREAMFIGMGLTYDERKQRLLRESEQWKAKRLDGNDDCAMIPA